MTTAYLLAREGKQVVVLDDGAIGGGMTGRTTAHLVNALDDRFYELERLHGILLTDLIVGRRNEWETLYDPTRKTLRALPKFAQKNLNVAVQYTDLATAGDVDSADEIKPGQGAIIRRGSKKVAVYRDDAGAVSERSAVWFHLGCIIDWNSKEKT